MARKVADDSDEVYKEDVREAARLLGRAISLSCIAATCGERMEDHAIERMDEAWTAFADKLMGFAEDER
jgi:hypothetical protein